MHLSAITLCSDGVSLEYVDNFLFKPTSINRHWEGRAGFTARRKMGVRWSAGACELSQKLLNERWTPYLQLRPAVVMLRGGIRLLGGLWSTFSTGSQRVPAPLANTSQRGKQARGGGRQAGSLIVCRSVDRTSLKMSGGLSVLSNSRAVSLGITEVCIS